MTSVSLYDQHSIDIIMIKALEETKTQELVKTSMDYLQGRQT